MGTSLRAIAPPPHLPLEATDDGAPTERSASQSLCERRWLERLDERVADPEARGVVSITGAPVELAALARHLLREARRTAGRRVLWAGGRGWSDPYRELAFYLGVDTEADPDEIAHGIVEAASDSLLVVQHPLPHPAAPNAEAAGLASAVADRLVSVTGTHRGLWLLLDPPRRLGETVVASACLSDADVRRFCISMIQSGAGPRAGASLAALEAWWGRSAGNVAVQPPSGAAPAVLATDEALTLERRLRLLGQSCAAGHLPRLCGGLDRDASSLWAELVEAGRAQVDERGHLAPLTDPESGATEALVATIEDRLAAQAVLEAMADPTSLLRAALLMAQAAEWDRAEVTVLRALAIARARGSRAVILESWSRAVHASASCDADARGGAIASRALRAADVALRHGIPELAQTLARRALALGASPLEGRIIEARAAMENGDLSAASAAFELGESAAGCASDRARLDAHLAELSILRGELEDAQTRATSALQLATGEQVRLVARNVLGKVLLARGEWARAEQHFAADESAASGAGEPEAELRARLNRAVALLSAGRRAEAVVVLETVERDATQRGMHRAAAFAQANLAAAATLAHDYGGALSRWESAIAAVRAAGDRPKLARLIANLAELRIRLGLLSEADEALAFGRRACRAGLSQPLASLLSFVAAKLRLAQGRTLLAATEIEAALSAASASSNGAKLGECHRLAARIAFEDGDLGRAATSLEAARQAAGGPDAEAELALLDGMLARGRGEPFEAVARRAAALAQQTGDPELARQAHILSFHAASERGDASLAASHLGQANRLRDEMAASLPDALRGRFLARPDLAAQGALEVAGGTVRSSSVGAAASAPSAPASSGRRSTRRAPVMVGETTSMKALGASIAKVGPSEVAVLIAGESGTGKELVADAVHRASARREGPLVKVNCAALVETLLLSELFGHEKGAFTGASSRHAGRFEEARGGTLFLDEIGDISPRTQVALLRVLQDGTYYRVGGTTPLRADVRVVCATHRDLRAMVERGEFRQDLYYRLCGVTLEVPALRDRLGDLPLLCNESLLRIAAERGSSPRRVSEAALVALRRHGWPGNVRELDNALRSASLFAEGDTIELNDLVTNVESLRYLADDVVVAGLEDVRPPSSRPPSSPASSLDAVYQTVVDGTSLPEMRRQLELGCILRALTESDGNVTQAAKKLGMKRPRLSQLIHQHGLKTKGGAS